MNTRMRAFALAVPLALTVLTGCGMTDDKSDGIPFAGTSTSLDAADTMEKVSSGIYDLVGVKGKTSENSPGVMDCSGKDTNTYFRIFHPWAFTPASASDLDKAMERLRAELPKHGWKIVEYGPNTSKNKNVTLTADNDKKKVSAKVTNMAKNDPPKLSLFLLSGCYKVPHGKEVERF
ncbi:hypothetical protein [Streptomyces sp. H27-C3]|uniref:hypothetical protein n=1 Tax=Streptomyces sp. H27-C3 TaxID=3046305 RepID=UPI0024BA85B6|nr:hypothetical protein [Streptomyces sp. H27-C3]MDJ0464051.1 hypothetical protein [Streptomyces sp. H27-C3]